MFIRRKMVSDGLTLGKLDHITKTDTRLSLMWTFSDLQSALEIARTIEEYNKFICVSGCKLGLYEMRNLNLESLLCLYCTVFLKKV